MTTLSRESMAAWEEWLHYARSRCHLHFRLEGGTVSTHVATGFKGAEESVRKVVADLPVGFVPKRILEIGSSVGFISLELARYYTGARVFSVEPDQEAVRVAAKMSEDAGSISAPLVGVGETLPFCSGCFDLIICHTVIEHVANVELVISEMARVLSPDGIIHLEAPNYLWPHEPHLGIWCLPLLGKRLVKLAAVLQGKNSECWYLHHLKFVTPGLLIRLFSQYGLVWKDLGRKKVLEVACGKTGVRKYRRMAELLRRLDNVGLARPLAMLAGYLGVYPSLIYVMEKRSVTGKDYRM